jgi:hypothetical protein
VRRDVLARGEVQRAAGGGAGGAGGEGELVGPVVEGPAGVVEQRASVLLAAQDLREAVLDGLVGADRAAEREALLGVADGHLERRLDGAQRLGGQQRLGQVPRAGELFLADVQAPAGRAVERHVPERARRVVARHGRDARRARVHGAGDRRAGRVATDHDEQVGAGRVGDPRDRAVEGHGVAVHRGRGSGRAVLAVGGVDGPAIDHVAGRPRGEPRGARLAGRDGAQRRVAGRLQQRARGQQAEERHAGQHAPALLQDQHRVEGAEPGAAVLLVDEQAGPSGLDGRRPQVRQLAALERRARRLHRVHARQRAARRLAQELLLVGEGEVHFEGPPSGSIVEVTLPPPPSPWRAAR